MKERQPALNITKHAKDTDIKGSEIDGVKNSGLRTSISDSKIYWFKKKHPVFFWVSITAAIITIIKAIFSLLL